MDDLVLEPGASYLMDRGYLDFARLFVIPDGHPNSPTLSVA